jgi:hypothetical protein
MFAARCTVVALCLLAHPEVHAGEVIVHPSVKLEAGDIRNVYLGEKQLAGDVRLLPVDNSACQDAFLAAVLQTNSRHYTARWRRKNFREGLSPPGVKGSDAEVMSFVRSTPGAVGYLVGPAGPGVVLLDRF